MTEYPLASSRCERKSVRTSNFESVSMMLPFGEAVKEAMCEGDQKCEGLEWLRREGKAREGKCGGSD
jgi:hypothetical protein